MTAPNVVAVDVGGTTVKAARVGMGDPVLRTVATPRDGGDILAATLELIDRLRTADTTAVGVVTAGLVDAAAGVVHYAANLGWRDLALGPAVEASTGLPVAVGNDVAAAAAAERAASDSDDLLFVAVGTGIATRQVADGRVLAGARGFAGELGHVVVVRDGEPCACGARGCLETYASGAAIERRYAARAGRHASAAEVAQRLDAVAVEVWDGAVRALADGLAIAVALHDPAEIVLGGGVARSGAALLTPLRAALTAALPWRAAPPVRVGRLGTEAGWRGAALLAAALPDRGVVGSGAAR